MLIIETDRVKCKFCLEILKADEVQKNGTICNQCASIIYKTPDLTKKMEDHIQNVKKFILKHSPKEVSLEEAVLFLQNDYLKTQEQRFTRGLIDDRYFDMTKSGIKVSGKLLMVSFIPRVVEIVKYTTFRKVQRITLATPHDKAFLRSYWLEHYFYDLPDNWDYVIHISFIQRNKSGYQEAIYCFPSCVIDKYYTLVTERPIHDIFSKVFTLDEFYSKYQAYSYFFDLRHMQQVSIQANYLKKLQNSAIIIITDSEWKENKFYEPENPRSQEYYRLKTYFYYNSKEKIFISISHHEYEFLMLTHLISFINTYYNLPKYIDISLSKKTKHGVYITIKSGSTFIAKTFINNENNYDIGKDPTTFFDNAKEQPKGNVKYIPIIHPGVNARFRYAVDSKILCNKCTMNIEEGQIEVLVEHFGEIYEAYHQRCIDLSYIKDEANLDELREQDRAVINFHV